MVLTYIHDPYIGTVTTGARVSIIANRDWAFPKSSSSTTFVAYDLILILDIAITMLTRVPKN